MHSMQAGYMEKAQKYTDKALMQIEKLKSMFSNDKNDESEWGCINCHMLFIFGHWLRALINVITSVFVNQAFVIICCGSSTGYNKNHAEHVYNKSLMWLLL